MHYRLSALTFKTLERMKEYVYIDEHVQRETLIWLSSKQNINGCFESDGKVFNNAWEVRNEHNQALLAPFALPIFPTSDLINLEQGCFLVNITPLNLPGIASFYYILVYPI